jgi:hypothetical protein
MKTLFYTFAIVFGVMFIACRSEIAPARPQTPKQWEKYIGTYDVYDTSNHTQWVMEIKFLSYSNPVRTNGGNDSLLLKNFANKFDIRYGFEASTDPYRIGLPFISPLKDKVGHSWAFFGNGEDSATPHLENYLANDSIVLYFKQSNIAFYATDGEPYYECDCKHIAVKRK